jgi:hypothetical protein
LNGRRFGVAELGDGLHDLVAQVEGGEVGGHVVLSLICLAGLNGLSGLSTNETIETTRPLGPL